MLIVETIQCIEEKENKSTAIDHTLFTGRRCCCHTLLVSSWKQTIVRKYLFLQCDIKKKMRERERPRKTTTTTTNTEIDRKSEEQALYTEEEEEKMRKRIDLQTRRHFFVARADDDRPVSVPVGNCCLELLDAD